MGLFDNIKKSGQNVGSMMQTSQQLGQEQAAIQGGAPADPNDPAFAPIEGVDVDTYAAIEGGLGKNMVMGPEAVEAYAVEHGCPAGKWHDVQMGWTARMQQYPHVAQRFGILLSQATM